MYNAITRVIEAELVPCLRKFGIRLVIYNPLAGGFFAGKVNSPQSEIPAGGRFDTSKHIGQMYSARYLQQGYFDALKVLQTATEAHNVRLTEIALRWCQHHSVLTPEDGVIIGASSLDQLIQNCEDSAKGPLDDSLVQALDRANRIVSSSGNLPIYWM
jgi:aflatoxin B1 aldehyde reductase